MTKEVFAKDDVKILEINSKTGLYPLYVTYSIFRHRCRDIENISLEEQNNIWYQTIEENLFIICKTPMAKAITKRTLIGFNKNTKINSHYFEDLINMLKNKPTQFVDKLLKPKYWDLKGSDNMKFDVVVGNPPYQISDGGNSASATPVYHLFVTTSKTLLPKYISMITPSRYFSGGKGLDEFRHQTLNDCQFIKFIDFINAKDCFPSSSVSGGVNYFLWENSAEKNCEFTTVIGNDKDTAIRKLNEFPIFIRYRKAVDIIRKLNLNEHSSISNITSSRNPFDLSTSIRGVGIRDLRHNVCIHSSKGVGYIEKDKITKGRHLLDKYKVLLSRIMFEHAGEPDSSGMFRVLSKIDVLEKNEICTDSYLILGEYSSLIEAENLKQYLKIKFVRFLILQVMSSINLSKDRFCFVPLQDFTENSDIDWTKKIPEIDQQLYRKYNLTQDEIDFIEKMIKPME